VTPDEARGRRLTSLRLSRPGTSPAELTDWFGAMQSQDLASGMWSLGVRLPGTAQADVESAIASGEVLRTWPMRGTIHLVHPSNARWMLELTGSRALRGLSARWGYLGLDAATAERAADVLTEALRGRRLTRQECLASLQDAGIDTAGGRAYHLLWHTAQIGVTCLGPNDGSQQTFVLLDEWAPDQRTPDRQEALALLATMFFRSHGPATLADFQRWTGLTLTDCRSGVGDADLRSAELEGRMVLYAEGPVATPPGVLLLPGFDEFILGYRDRSLVLAPGHSDRIVPGGNGMFRPTVVHRGRVVGTWSRKALTRTVRITVEGFEPLKPRVRKALEAPATRYARYLGRDDLDLRFG
jgi:hypothetical protein